MKKYTYLLVIIAVCMTVQAQTNQPGKMPLYGHGGEVGYTIYREKPTQEVELNLLYIFPQQDEFWDHAAGLESQWRFWSEYGGVAFTLGLSQWRADMSGMQSGINAQSVKDVTLIELNQLIATINDAEENRVAERNANAGPDADTITASLIPEATDVVINDFSIDGDAWMLPLGISFIYKPTLYTVPLEIALEVGVRYFFVMKEDVNANVTYSNPSGSITGSTEKSVSIKEGAVAIAAVDAALALNESVDIFFGAGYQFDLIKGTATISGDGGHDLIDTELGGSVLRIGLQFNY
jgi:hypothetical protein